MQKITPCLWFDGQAEEAAAFYTSIFKRSQILKVHPGPGGKALVVYFQLEGQDFIGLNGGPQFKITEAISLSVDCKTQEEVDELSERLIAGGGQQSRCSWLKDKFGVSWQIVPSVLPELLWDPDPEKAQRVMQAMMKMDKIDIAALRRAHEGR